MVVIKSKSVNWWQVGGSLILGIIVTVATVYLYDSLLHRWLPQYLYVYYPFIFCPIYSLLFLAIYDNPKRKGEFMSIGWHLFPFAAAVYKTIEYYIETRYAILGGWPFSLLHGFFLLVIYTVVYVVFCGLFLLYMHSSFRWKSIFAQ